MGLGDITDDIARSLGNMGAQVNETLFENSVRLGVTGLSRAGKSVFITSLVANLLAPGRMPQLTVAATGALQASFLQPQPDDTVPRFAYEQHLNALLSDPPRWPESTKGVSELRLSFRIAPRGLFSGLSGPKTVHLDIVDYPGEWLLDLALLDKSYDVWSRDALARMAAQPAGAALAERLAGIVGAKPYDEAEAQDLAAAYADFVGKAHEAKMSSGAPGRILLPGELAGSPVLTLVPLAKVDKPARDTLAYEMERRFNAYKSQVIKPFFKSHFARIDRQIVLVDMLGALHRGPAATQDLRRTMADILGAFKPGRNAWLSTLWAGRRVDRILFAATKADHLHHTQHPRLSALTETLLAEAKSRAEFSGAKVGSLSIAGVRSTSETEVAHNGRMLPCVQGYVEGREKPAAFYAGELPEDPARVLAEATADQEKWLGADFGAMQFRPNPGVQKPDMGPPHIRLDKAIEFLIGDKLQ